jgi:putative tricarboxylic transport membrane protein
MTLERFLALFFLTISIIYGYTAFFVLDATLAPFMKMTPVWPSSFPKIVSSLGIVAGLLLVFSSIKPTERPADVIEAIKHYQWRPAISLLVMMVAYALLLRPMGFIITTFIFLSLGAIVLGERKLPLLLIIALCCAGGIWYLVQQVLGIYLRPWPWFLSGGF